MSACCLMKVKVMLRACCKDLGKSIGKFKAKVQTTKYDKRLLLCMCESVQGFSSCSP